MDAQEFLSPPEIPIAGASKDHTASLFENSNLFSTQATPKSPLAGNIEEVIIIIIEINILSVRVKKGWMMIYADSPGLVAQRPADAMCNVMTPGVGLGQIPI